MTTTTPHSPPSVAAEHLTGTFDYELPLERIAQTPPAQRDASRLLHITDTVLTDHVFTDLPDLLDSGDLLVANESRVRAARLLGRREDGGSAELLVLSPAGNSVFACLVRPARRLPEGALVTIGDDLAAVVDGSAPGHPGARLVTFRCGGDVVAAIERHGVAPLPPYIREPLQDPERYQTTYASGSPASAAAPTAGLHFTEAVRARLRERGVGWTTVNLEVGLGTFAPIRAERIDEHEMHEERYALSAETAALINETRRRGGRVIAVGTTSMRVLESCAADDGTVAPAGGTTRLYITPGYTFRAVDGLLTNFHQPRSSLLVLVAAFIGLERWRAAYTHALEAGYRFLSFGDCMVCWRQG